MFIQHLWLAKMDWDDKINEKLSSEWSNFIHDILKLKSVQIPRYSLSQFDIVSVQLHGFGDASLKAFGACIDSRTFHSDISVSCRLPASKCRVALLKTNSLPRLEWLATTLLFMLYSKIEYIFKNKLHFSPMNV